MQEMLNVPGLRRFFKPDRSTRNVPCLIAKATRHLETVPECFQEIFEIAEPGKDFELYSRSRLTRVR